MGMSTRVWWSFSYDISQSNFRSPHWKKQVTGRQHHPPGSPQYIADGLTLLGWLVTHEQYIGKICSSTSVVRWSLVGGGQRSYHHHHVRQLMEFLRISGTLCRGWPVIQVTGRRGRCRLVVRHGKKKSLEWKHSRDHHLCGENLIPTGQKMVCLCA
jgi:hypothetical protein